MTDKKLTDNEIIKALETLLELVLCEGYPQRAKTINLALDLINRQKADIEIKEMDIQSLTSERDALQEMVEEQKAEIERLQRLLDEADKKYNLCAKRFFKEGVRELVKKIKEDIEQAISTNINVIAERQQNYDVSRYEDDICIMCDSKIRALLGIGYLIDGHVKEMVGEDK